MNICGRCKKANNPQGGLNFLQSPEGVLCENCYSKLYDLPVKETTAGPDYSVIVCPDCRGSHHSTHGIPCKACCGYGAVRIKTNALPIYLPGNVESKQVLMEDK